MGAVHGNVAGNVVMYSEGGFVFVVNVVSAASSEEVELQWHDAAVAAVA